MTPSAAPRISAVSAVPSPSVAAKGTARSPLWSSLSHKSVEHLRSETEAFLAKLDDALFDLSEGGGTAGAHSFFEGMRALRKCRSAVIATTVRRVSENWVRCESSGAYTPHAHTPHAHTSHSHTPHAHLPHLVSSPELSLMDDDVLEERLAVEGAARAVEGIFKEDLMALRARLAILMGAADAQTLELPVDPLAVIAAFRAGLNEVEMLSTEVKIVIYKRFERDVLARLQGLYRSLNAVLVGAGILRQWSPTAPPRAPGSVPASLSHPHPSSDADPAFRPDVAPHEQSNPGSWFPREASAQTVLNAIHAWLGPVRGYGHSAGYPEQASSATVDELLSALAWVSRHRASNQQASSSNPWTTPGDEAAASRQLKEDLCAILAAQHESRAGGASSRTPTLGLNEGVIDLVSMMFDYVARDAVLPATLQADLSRLQMPFLRIGISEPDLFAKPDHVARRLLNALSDAGKVLSDGVATPTAKSVEERIHTVVERLSSASAADRALFEEELSSFEKFMDAVSLRTQLREKRMVEASYGVERRAEATREVAGCVVPFVRDGNFPSWLSLLFLRSWSSALILVHLREGPQSKVYTAALAWMDTLADLNRSHPGEDLIQRVAARWVLLRPTWMDMLTRASLSETEVLRWTEALKSWLDSKARGATVAMDDLLHRAKELPHPELKEPPLPSASGPSVPPHDQPEANALKAPGSDPASSLEMPSMKASSVHPDPVVENPDAPRFELGTWLEFVGQPSRRGKLIYISPFTQRLLFVTTTGERLREASREELQADINMKRAILLTAQPLFERALDTIMRNMRNSLPGGTPQHHPNTAARVSEDQSL